MFRCVVVNIFVVKKDQSGRDAGHVRTDAIKKALKYFDKKIGGRPAVEQTVRQWAKKHPKELPSKKPTSTRVLVSKPDEKVAEANEYVCCKIINHCSFYSYNKLVELMTLRPPYLHSTTTHLLTPSKLR
jgi:hypothetical protein